eukprot:6206502-Pleurochrysis_carterae.AAC.2
MRAGAGVCVGVCDCVCVCVFVRVRVRVRVHARVRARAHVRMQSHVSVRDFYLLPVVHGPDLDGRVADGSEQQILVRLEYPDRSSRRQRANRDAAVGKVPHLDRPVVRAREQAVIIDDERADGRAVAAQLVQQREGGQRPDKDGSAV